MDWAEFRGDREPGTRLDRGRGSGLDSSGLDSRLAVDWIAVWQGMTRGSGRDIRGDRGPGTRLTGDEAVDWIAD